jgi:metacaspase-1
MKNVLFFLLLLSQIAFTQTKISPTDPTKKAFVVAISQYDPATGWNSISSDQDLKLIRQYLAKEGFSTVVVLENQKATKAAVVKSFRDFIGQCNKGDKVILHFSGHGIQLTDLDGDEADGYDESLVCYDSPKIKIDSSYDGSKHLLDDEWNVLVTDLRTKLGISGHVLAVIDACHSGTISRGNPTVKVRGGELPIVLRRKKVSNPKSKANETSGFSERTTGIGGLAKYVCLGGSPSHKENHEINIYDPKTGAVKQSYGSLTYGVSKAFQKLRPQTTYRQFYANALFSEKSQDDYHQPILEGDIETLFFGGDYRGTKPYYEVKEVDSEELTLGSGSFSGLYPESKVAVCQVGTEYPTAQNTLATGIITKTNETESVVKLNKALGQFKPGQIVVFVTEESTAHLSLKVFLGDLPPSDQERVKSQAKNFSNVVWTDKKILAELCIALEKDSLQFYSVSSGLPYARRCVNRSEEIRKRLFVFSQIKYWLSLNVQNSEYEGEMQLSNSLNCEFLSKEAYQKTNDGVLKVFAGDPVCLFIRNPQSRHLYFTILEFTPEGEFHVISNATEPLKQTTIQLHSGQKFGLEPHEKGGVHTVKLFVTENPLPLEELLLTQQEIKRRSGIGETRSVKLPSMYTQTILYDLQRRNQ